MNTQTTPVQRREFYARHLKGQTYEQIAARYDLSKECVRYWCRRQRDGGSCQSSYHRSPSGILSRFDPRVKYAILRLRLELLRLGPNGILTKLRKRPDLRGLVLPSPASIGRYLHQWSRFQRQFKPQEKQPRPCQPTTVHQRWQIDFKLAVALQDEARANLMTVWDPVGEACLGAWLFPAQVVDKRENRVTLDQLRTGLRLCFARWRTLPAEIQTDNESVFVGKPDDPFPSDFSLWLTGLDIKHLAIRSGQPTDNAEVERGHHTVHDYVLMRRHKCALAETQQLLDEATHELVFEFPSRAEDCHGHPPVKAHPELLQAPRPFRPEWELALFDLHRVDQFMSTLTWSRRVGKTGQISLGGHDQRYSVGRKYAQREVIVRFDAADRNFVFCDPEQPDVEIGRKPARNLTIEKLSGLIPWPADLVPQQLALPLPLAQGVSS